MKKILVADDSKDIVHSIKEMLIPFFDVHTATTGYGIRKLLGREDYAGLILDVDFGPGMNGLEIASMIRESNKNIKIIICSAVAYSDSVQQQAIEIGAKFHEKPIPLNFILETMEA